MWARLTRVIIMKGTARKFSQISQLRNRACALKTCLECLRHCFDLALGFGPDSIPFVNYLSEYCLYDVA